MGDAFAHPGGFYERTRGLTVGWMLFAPCALILYTRGQPGIWCPRAPTWCVWPRVYVFGPAIDLVRSCTGQRTNPDATGLHKANYLCQFKLLLHSPNYSFVRVS